jgi:transposase
MLNQEEVVEMRVRVKRGESIRQLAQAMGMSRNTVRRYLRGAGAQRQVSLRPSKLDPFKEYLVERIAQARPDWIAATVLTREIAERGYEGGVGMVKAFIRTHKPMPRPDPVVRFETAPGVQMQADFVVFRRRELPLLAFVATLGCSRASFVRFTTDENADTVGACLVQAFEFFGGVPREVLFDNAKSVIITRDAYGIGLHRFHAGLLEVANAYGFTPRVCRPYRARTKGKVERFNRFLREGFYVPLRSRLQSAGLLLDAGTANIEVSRWLREVANARVHGTTQQIPAECLIAERAALLPLPRTLPTLGTLPIPLAVPTPTESIQHPLAVYRQLLEMA